MLVTVDIRQRAAPVRALLIQRYELVPGGVGDQYLKLAGGVYHFDSTARLDEFRGAGQVYDDQAGLDARRARRHLRQRAAVV